MVESRHERNKDEGVKRLHTLIKIKYHSND